MHRSSVSRVTAGRLVVLAATAALILIAAGAEALRAAGWRINLTASAPLGLYHLKPVTSVQIPRGSLVECCPPAWITPTAFPFYMSGDCPGGGRAMLKTIVGIPGDQVRVTDDGVNVNGLTLPGSVPRLQSVQDPEIALPRFRGAVLLGPGQYWVYGGGSLTVYAARSFDSRYYGPITGAQIRGAVVK